MKLSTRGRYAVTAMADIALHSGFHAGEEAQLITLAEISERQDISLSYLEQLFGRLRRAELVASARGPGGGYRLARPAAAIRISDIMTAVDETLRATKCDGIDGAGCPGGREACLTHDLWEHLSAQVYLILHQISLEDVVGKRLVPCNAFPNFATLLESEDPAAARAS